MKKKFIYLFELFLTLIFSPLFEYRSLDTRMVDRHINELKQYSWFLLLYEDEKFRRLFYTNYKIRKYLESPFRVERLMKNSHAQEKFKQYLGKQLLK
ncbi:hypothetical protein [Neobacillus sp. D3-1R]|uniref:hypothetical protein n=1 Tax=Neobacillus sp. D3-1R TaxID=3445778 RepID=UPI003FA111C7